MNSHKLDPHPILSILIPTHNRPILFKRSIEKLLKILPHNVEIIINNDSNDIVEINHPNIKYFYNIFENLGLMYEFLFSESNGTYIYYLEDDDYILNYFFQVLDLINNQHIDIFIMNYIKHDSSNIGQLLNIDTLNTDNDFQLSQILFKKLICSQINLNNNLDNDWKLYQHIIQQTNNIKIIQKPMFKQTVDGKDNISFIHLNKDNRWPIL